MQLKNSLFLVSFYQFPDQAHVMVLGLPFLVAAWIYTETEAIKSYRFQEGGKAVRLSVSSPWW